MFPTGIFISFRKFDPWAVCWWLANVYTNPTLLVEINMPICQNEAWSMGTKRSVSVLVNFLTPYKLYELRENNKPPLCGLHGRSDSKARTSLVSWFMAGLIRVCIWLGCQRDSSTAAWAVCLCGISSGGKTDCLAHWKPLHNINCAHLGTSPLLKFNGIVY